MDIRLKSLAYQYGEHTYNLVCNMNVLADVQEAMGGNLSKALSQTSSIKNTLTFLAAMLNDAADTEGRPERFTAKELGRHLTMTEIGKIGGDIWAIVAAGIGDLVEPEDADEKKY